MQAVLFGVLRSYDEACAGTQQPYLAAQEPGKSPIAVAAVELGQFEGQLRVPQGMPKGQKLTAGRMLPLLLLLLLPKMRLENQRDSVRRVQESLRACVGA